jgi:hypothetical protein
MTITKTLYDKIRKDNRVLGLLAANFAVQSRTIEAWIDSNDIRLTTPLAVNTLIAETGMKESEMFENLYQPI